MINGKQRQLDEEEQEDLQQVDNDDEKKKEVCSENQSCGLEQELPQNGLKARIKLLQSKLHPHSMITTTRTNNDLEKNISNKNMKEKEVEENNNGNQKSEEVGGRKSIDDDHDHEQLIIGDEEDVIILGLADFSTNNPSTSPTSWSSSDIVDGGRDSKTKEDTTQASRNDCANDVDGDCSPDDETGSSSGSSSLAPTPPPRFSSLLSRDSVKNCSVISSADENNKGRVDEQGEEDQTKNVTITISGGKGINLNSNHDDNDITKNLSLSNSSPSLVLMTRHRQEQLINTSRNTKPSQSPVNKTTTTSQRTSALRDQLRATIMPSVFRHLHSQHQQQQKDHSAEEKDSRRVMMTRYLSHDSISQQVDTRQQMLAGKGRELEKKQINIGVDSMGQLQHHHRHDADNGENIQYHSSDGFHSSTRNEATASKSIGLNEVKETSMQQASDNTFVTHASIETYVTTTPLSSRKEPLVVENEKVLCEQQLKDYNNNTKSRQNGQEPLKQRGGNSQTSSFPSRADVSREIKTTTRDDVRKKFLVNNKTKFKQHNNNVILTENRNSTSSLQCGEDYCCELPPHNNNNNVDDSTTNSQIIMNVQQQDIDLDKQPKSADVAAIGQANNNNIITQQDNPIGKNGQLSLKSSSLLANNELKKLKLKSCNNLNDDVDVCYKASERNLDYEAGSVSLNSDASNTTNVITDASIPTRNVGGADGDFCNKLPSMKHQRHQQQRQSDVVEKRKDYIDIKTKLFNAKSQKVDMSSNNDNDNFLAAAQLQLNTTSKLPHQSSVTSSASSTENSAPNSPLRHLNNHHQLQHQPMNPTIYQSSHALSRDFQQNNNMHQHRLLSASVVDANQSIGQRTSSSIDVGQQQTTTTTSIKKRTPINITDSESVCCDDDSTTNFLLHQNDANANPINNNYNSKLNYNNNPSTKKSNDNHNYHYQQHQQNKQFICMRNMENCNNNNKPIQHQQHHVTQIISQQQQPTSVSSLINNKHQQRDRPDLWSSQAARTQTQSSLSSNNNNLSSQSLGNQTEFGFSGPTTSLGQRSPLTKVIQNMMQRSNQQQLQDYHKQPQHHQLLPASPHQASARQSYQARDFSPAQLPAQAYANPLIHQRPLPPLPPAPSPSRNRKEQTSTGAPALNSRSLIMSDHHQHHNQMGSISSASMTSLSSLATTIASSSTCCNSSLTVMTQQQQQHHLSNNNHNYRPGKIDIGSCDRVASNDTSFHSSQSPPPPSHMSSQHHPHFSSQHNQPQSQHQTQAMISAPLYSAQPLRQVDNNVKTLQAKSNPLAHAKISSSSNTSQSHQELQAQQQQRRVTGETCALTNNVIQTPTCSSTSNFVLNTQNQLDRTLTPSAGDGQVTVASNNNKIGASPTRSPLHQQASFHSQINSSRPDNGNNTCYPNNNNKQQHSKGNCEQMFLKQQLHQVGPQVRHQQQIPSSSLDAKVSPPSFSTSFCDSHLNTGTFDQIAS